MRKAIALALLLALAAGCVSQNGTNEQDGPSGQLAYTNQDFIDVLNTDPDAAEFIASNEFVLEITKLEPEHIEGNLTGDDSYLYGGLPMKILYKVEFVNDENRGFQTVVDMETGEVLKLYGLIRIGMDA